MYVHRSRVNPGGQEKGVDGSLALDLVRSTHDRQFEVAVIVSQDWDFGASGAPGEGNRPSTRAAGSSSRPASRSDMEAFRGEGFRELPGFRKPRKPATPAAIRETTAQAGSERSSIEIVCHFNLSGLI